MVVRRVSGGVYCGLLEALASAHVNDNKSVLAFNLSYLFHRDDILGEAMDRLLGWVASDRVAEAHRAFESRTTLGKLAL